MNNEKFDRVIEFVHAHPDKHDQGQWFARRPEGYAEVKCDTVGCIAGWAAILNGWQPVWETDYGDDPVNSSYAVKDGVKLPYHSIGAAELELCEDQADWMFNGGRTLEEIEDFGNALKVDPYMTTELYEEYREQRVLLDEAGADESDEEGVGAYS